MRKEIIRPSLQPRPQPQPQPQPLFSHDIPITQQRFDPGLGQIRVLPIVTEQPKFGIEQFRERVSAKDRLTQELRDYHRQADRANELALLKQVEALKNIVSQQTKKLDG